MKWLRRFITEVLAHASSLSLNPFVKKLNNSNTNATKIKIKNDEEMMMVQMGGVFSKLPSDIFLDILSRVPLKSLCQCKWVCKTWFKIIHQPRFAEMQYAKQIQNTKCSPFIVVKNRHKDFFLVDSQVFDDFGTSTTASSLEMKGINDAYTRKGLMMEYEVVGCVNGLICFGGYKSRKLPYYICNPITGDYSIIPLSPKYEIEHVRSEFGFSSTTNEYKVIRILQNRDKNFLAEAEIFTLGSDSCWRLIEGLPYGRCFNQSLLLNGYLHWMPTENMKTKVIVAFNVGTEELDVIQLPPCVKQVVNIFKNMLVLGENLCFIDGDSDDFGSDIWVMKSYGVATSWVKEYVINKSNGLSMFCFKNYEVMKLWNGELLLLLHRYERTLGYYDLKRGTFKRIAVHEMPKVDTKPIMVSGSLFSPKNVHKLIKRNKEFRPAMLKRHNFLMQKWLSS